MMSLRQNTSPLFQQNLEKIPFNSLERQLEEWSKKCLNYLVSLFRLVVTRSSFTTPRIPFPSDSGFLIFLTKKIFESFRQKWIRKLKTA